MKKHLIAAAVAAAVAVPAMAQNIEVYGVLDVAAANFDQGGTTKSYTTTTNSLISSSRLGFRGSEDLGGGLKARFVLEMGVNPNSGGVAGSTDTATNITKIDSSGGTSGVLFNRDAFVALDGAFGSIAIGKIDTSQTEGVDTFTTQIGNLGFVGGVEIGGDNTGTVRYTTPNFNGFTAQIGKTLTGRTAYDASDAGDIESFSVAYVNGPLGLIAGTERYNEALTAKSTRYTAFGARYDFGVASVGVMQGKASDVATVGSAASDVTVTIASARVPLGNGLALHGAYRMSDVSNNGPESTSPAIALTKALSKRTTVYAAYATTSYDANTAATVKNKGTTPASVDGNSFFFNGATDGDNGSVAAVGIVHSF
jgi:predicted porin